MTRSFRFEPPEPRSGSLTRPRLLRALLGRWEQRVTVMVGGPGLGKTTLLAQAVAENRLAPRGEDVWLGLAPGDADGEMLARDLMVAVASPSGIGADGDPIAVRASIHTINGLSAHAGQSELLEWLEPMVAGAPRVVLTHGEERARAPLARQIAARHGISCELPEYGDTIVL